MNAWAKHMIPLFAISSAILFLVAFVLLNSVRQKQGQSELAMKFGPDSSFVGKSLQEIVDDAGPYNLFGYMDHGTAVAQWKRGALIVDVWLENEKCVAIDLSTNCTR